MTQINAYLHFNGNCREAMTFYKACLGGVKKKYTHAFQILLPVEKLDTR